MHRSGPISFLIHGIVEYVAALAFIAAPFLLDFRSDAATWLSVAVGVVVLVVASTTKGPVSLVDALPISIHVLLDYVLALLLIASPFLFGFSEEGPPTAWFITLGVVHLLLTIATRFVDEPGDDGHGGVGALAHGTSVDVEAGERTAVDEGP